MFYLMENIANLNQLVLIDQPEELMTIVVLAQSCDHQLGRDVLRHILGLSQSEATLNKKSEYNVWSVLKISESMNLINVIPN